MKTYLLEKTLKVVEGITYNSKMSYLKIVHVQNMINKIDKERRHSMNAAPTRPSNITNIMSYKFTFRNSKTYYKTK
jgi:hypothetical protein